MKEFEFRHVSKSEFIFGVQANSKSGAIKILRLLMKEPEMWALAKIRDTRECWIHVQPPRELASTEDPSTDTPEQREEN